MSQQSLYDLKLNLSDSIFFLEQNELFIKFGKTFGQVQNTCARKYGFLIQESRFLKCIPGVDMK